MDFIEKIKILYKYSSDMTTGYSDKEISETENRLKVKFPKVLRDYYLQYGRAEGINDTDDKFVKLNKLSIRDGRICFCNDYADYHYCYYIKLSDFENENPRTYLLLLQEDKHIDTGLTLEETLFKIACCNGIMGGLRYHYYNKWSDINANSEIKKGIIEVIEKNHNPIIEISDQYDKFFTKDYSEIIRIIKNKRANIPYWLGIGSNLKEKVLDITNKAEIPWE